MTPAAQDNSEGKSLTGLRGKLRRRALGTEASGKWKWWGMREAGFTGVERAVRHSRKP